MEDHCVSRTCSRRSHRVDTADAALMARTTVIVMGDNGTPGHSVRAPWDATRAKATLFDGGTRVPLLVSGPGVVGAGRQVDALVHAVDLLPTILDLAGVGTPEDILLDGHSLRPLLEDPDAGPIREEVYLERFYPNGASEYRDIDVRAVRELEWKLLRDRDGKEGLFRYVAGALDEGEDLLVGGSLDEETAGAYLRLRDSLDRYDAELTSSHQE